MVIYENNINGFIEQCKPSKQDLLISSIKTNMRHKLGRGVSPSEERSWKTTLIKVSRFFETLKNKDDQYILLEFKVPTTQKRIDVILVGSDGKRNSLLIIELKGWSESFESEITNALKINASYGYAVGHPNREASEYKYLLTQQFSDINTEFENLDAISLLPNYELIKNDPILNKQFQDMLNEIRLYTKSDSNELVGFLNEMFNHGIPRSKVDFLNKLEYKPTLGFQQHLEQQFRNIRLSASQWLAYSTIITEIDNHLSKPNNKKLITISGMPGSGKTIIAFKVMAYIYTQKKMTAKLQLPGPEFRSAIKQLKKDNTFNNMIGGAFSKGEHQVQIIDEAHKAYGQGTSKQFYSELFAKQNFVIALIDDKQVVNKKGFTKQEVIKKAQNNNFDIVDIELQEQFRNGGDSLYIDWLNNWIFNEKNQQLKYRNNTYSFEVLPEKDFNDKYLNMYNDFNVRMSSFWTQKWNAEFDNEGQPKRLIKIGNSNYIWNPNNYWVKSFIKSHPDENIPKWFIKNVVDKNFNSEKKGPEYIAYFNTIQGSEFDFIFVHIPKLFYLNHNNELDVDLKQLDYTDMKTQVWMTKGQPSKEKEDLNKLYLKNRLLVNLTRGKKGTYIYCEDEKLGEWINNKILKNSVD